MRRKTSLFTAHSDKIGVLGHLQGGVGAINLATAQGSKIRSIYTASASSLELSHTMRIGKM